MWELAERHLPFIPRELWSSMPALRAAGRVTMVPDPDGEPACNARSAGCSRRPPRPRHRSVRMWRRGRTVLRRKVFRRGPVRSRIVLRWCVGRHRGRGWGGEDDRGGRAVELARLRAHRLLHDAHGEAVVVCRSLRIVKGLLKLAAATKRTSTSSAKSLRSSLAAGEGGLSVRNRARLGLGGPHGSRPLPHVSEGETSRHERVDRDLRPIPTAGGLPDGRSGDRPVAGSVGMGAMGRDGWPDSSDATTNASGIPTP